MKKVLGFVLLLALFATSVSAFNSPQRTQGLRFGAWTPQGFDASADTTFLNGAVQTVDTTDAFNASWADWGANSVDPNTGLPVLRLWVAGDFISCDSVKVIVHQSFDKRYWWVASSGTSGGNVVQGNQTAFSVPFTFTATPGVATAPATVNLIAAPYIRFSIGVDGNTAARMPALRAWVTYDDIRDNPNEQPMMVVKRVKFGTHGAQGFAAEKDTASITFTGVDTTETFNLQDWAKGPSGQNPGVADSLTSFGTLVGVFTDVSTNDSIYIQQQVGPDGVHFSTPRLSADQLHGNWAGIVTAVLPADLDGTTKSGFLVNVGQANPTVGSRVNGLGNAPFARFTIRGGNGGEVMGATQCWMSYWRIPRK